PGSRGLHGAADGDHRRGRTPRHHHRLRLPLPGRHLRPDLSPPREKGAPRAPTPPPAGRGPHEAPSGDESPERPGDGWSAEVAISPTLAHVYTECARIWNPIHTDRAVARAAGLPDIILHGTATLALAVSRALRHDPRGAATPVRALACRFGAMVPLPSRLVVRGRRAEPSPDGPVVRFEALVADGRPAIRDGRIVLGGG